MLKPVRQLVCRVGAYGISRSASDLRRPIVPQPRVVKAMFGPSSFVAEYQAGITYGCSIRLRGWCRTSTGLSNDAGDSGLEVDTSWRQAWRRRLTDLLHCTSSAQPDA